MDLVHPICRGKFEKLASHLEDDFEAGRTKSLFKPFETYRSPERQDFLFHHLKTTKAMAYQSSHQFGLAVDFVAWHPVTQHWSWSNNEDWAWLESRAIEVGLGVPIGWDRPHVEDVERWQALRRLIAKAWY